MSAVDHRQRIGDAEREYATSELARHYAEGRLDHDEYTERLDAAWTARTHDDLRMLFNDLPRPAMVASRPALPARARRVPLWWRAAPWAVGLFVVLVVLALLD